MPKFSERLRFLRVTKELSQAEFAKMIGVSKSSVNMYERGEREPGLETLERIADYFNVDMDYLLGKSDTERKTPFEHFLPIASGRRKTVTYYFMDNGIVLSEDENDFLLKFRSLDDRGKAVVINILEHEFNSIHNTAQDASSKDHTDTTVRQRISK